MNPILIDPLAFIQMYLRSEKVVELPNAYRVGNKGSKQILKDGSAYWDYEEGNFTSIFLEIKQRYTPAFSARGGGARAGSPGPFSLII